MELDLAAFTGLAVYLIVFVVIFVETGLLVGLVLPGDSLLFGAGLLAATGKVGVSVVPLALTVLAAAVAGDTLGYLLGHRLGRPYLIRSLPRRGSRFVGGAERLYARHGWFAVLAARWFPGLRAIVPVLAGIGGMPRGWFLAANVLGALLWAVGLVVLGYLSYAIPAVRDFALVAMGLTIAAALGYVVICWLRRRQRTARWFRRGLRRSAEGPASR